MAGQSNRISYPSLRWSVVLVLLISIVGDGLASRKSSAQSPITSSGLNTQVNLALNPPVGKTQYDITGGTRPGGGSNLFHSFGEFNVPNNNIANFLNSGSVDLAGNALPAGLQTSNILARVTGTDGNHPTLSSIYGAIQTTGFGNANLFLMNPAGFLFGPNATVNVGGMVAFTSADYLKLTDGVLFNKTPNVVQDALLSTAHVAAFGFLGSNPGLISVQGSQFTVTEATGISLVGGDISIQAGTLDNGTVQPAKLSAPSGQINLASIASPGEIAVETLTPGSNVDGVAPSSFGHITLSENAQLTATGTSRGTIRIRGGELMMDSAFMFADSTVGTPDPTTAIAINMEGDAILTNRSFIQARALGPDGGGDIELAAENISLLDGSAIRTEGRGAGQAGDILVAATGNIVISGVDAFDNPSRIETLTLGSGDSGSINVTASQVALADMGLIQTGTFGQKQAGDIVLSVDRLDITGGGAVHTSGGDSAPSGSIHIVATDTISLSGIGQLDGLSSRIENENPSGDTGIIDIETNNLNLSNNGRIHSLTALAATEPVDPKINVTAHNAMTLSEQSRIDVNAFETDVGALTIQAGSLSLSGLSVINTETSGPGASGPINIATGALTVTVGSQIISASNQGLGNGGHISIVTTGDVTLAGQATNSFGEVQSSGIFSRTNAFSEDPSVTGNAGNITLTANGTNVSISDGARIDSGSTGFALGNAGNIQINAGSLFTMTDSSVTTEADAASGGAIKITTDPNGTVQLTNSTISASVLDGTGGGGSVNIDPQFVILQNSHILATATHGPGGNISITTNLLLPDAYSTISASSQFGVNGTVTIQSPNAPGSGQVQPLGKSPLLPTSLLNQHCASLAGGEFSSFTVAGRDSLPTEPGSWLASPLATLNAGMGLGGKAEGMKAEGEKPDIQILSLRQIVPAGFLTQAFALDWSAGCQS